jgi:hypothetical protein
MSMTHESEGGSRRKAGAAAALLVLAGVALGVVVDRLWLMPPEAAAMPLTPEALVAHLELRPEDEARVRVLLESLHGEVTSAAAAGPEALAAVARSAHERIEQALPPEARPAFREWVEEHHAQMTERMHGGAMHRQMHGQP